MRVGFVAYMTALKPTAVFIDGYNLYYGRLRGTSYKWLDVVSLFDQLLRDQDSLSELISVSYFSAPALGRFATHGQASVLAQQDYVRALQQLHPTRFSLVMGKHSYDRDGTSMPRFVEGEPFDRTRRIKVWKVEEKQTDVNLALSMYRAACSGRFKQLVVCSNDSDAAPALKALRADFTELAIGVITPRKPPCARGQSHRWSSTSLQQHSTWLRHHLLDAELEAAQLPDLVRTNKRPIRKPSHWCAPTDSST